MFSIFISSVKKRLAHIKMEAGASDQRKKMEAGALNSKKY